MSQSLFFCPHYSGPATRNSQNLAPLLLHKPVHQSHPTVLVNKKSGNTKAVYIVLHSHVVHLFCTLHARYTNATYLTSHEVSMWTGWSCCRSSHREFEKSLFVDSPATRASKDMATLTWLFWQP